MKRPKEDTPGRHTEDDPNAKGFADRIALLIAEYGSRYALAKATGIPVSTLQNYALGSKPGMDALATLARVGNVDATWLLTGRGSIRGAGQLPGAVLADVIMVDQYDPSWSLSLPRLVNEIPFSRRYLENTLRLSGPTHDSLMAIESVWNLWDIVHGDLLLIDRTQGNLTADGAYLLNLPGFSLRGILTRFEGKLRIVEPRPTQGPNSNRHDRAPSETSESYEMDRSELIGLGRRGAWKVVGRAVWVGRRV